LTRRTVARIARRDAPTAGADVRAECDHALKKWVGQSVITAAVKRRNIRSAQFTSTVKSIRVNVDQDQMKHCREHARDIPKLLVANDPQR
jgi:hypothetical protein